LFTWDFEGAGTEEAGESCKTANLSKASMRKGKKTESEGLASVQILVLDGGGQRGGKTYRVFDSRNWGQGETGPKKKRDKEVERRGNASQEQIIPLQSAHTFAR